MFGGICVSKCLTFCALVSLEALMPCTKIHLRLANCTRVAPFRGVTPRSCVSHLAFMRHPSRLPIVYRNSHSYPAPPIYLTSHSLVSHVDSCLDHSSLYHSLGSYRLLTFIFNTFHCCRAPRTHISYPALVSCSSHVLITRRADFSHSCLLPRTTRCILHFTLLS